MPPTQMFHTKGIVGTRLRIEKHLNGMDIRGGSWLRPAGNCRCAVRGWLPPGFRDSSVGFRLAIYS